jgi:hypothetical protein
VSLPRHEIPQRALRRRASCDWEAPEWRDVPALEIACFHPQSSAHRPRTRARLAWDPVSLHAIFRVEDRWVRCVHLDYQSPVYRDSCVELFVAPCPGHGHFNFEVSCGGGLLVSHVEDPRRTPGGFARATPVDAVRGRAVEVRTSLAGRIEPERAGPVTWTAALRIPFALFADFVGPVAPQAGAVWRANLFKCADDSSHPHWASWAPIGGRLDFHQPAKFGELVFGSLL